MGSKNNKTYDSPIKGSKTLVIPELEELVGKNPRVVWTAEMDDILKQYYPRKDLMKKYIAAYLHENFDKNMTFHRMRSRAQILGLQRVQTMPMKNELEDSAALAEKFMKKDLP